MRVGTQLQSHTTPADHASEGKQPGTARSNVHDPEGGLQIGGSRSLAWLFWGVLGGLTLLGSVLLLGKGSVGQAFLGVILAALMLLYARYLYRGGAVAFVVIPGCSTLVLMGVLSLVVASLAVAALVT